jgi:excisionase family DNA binding protein
MSIIKTLRETDEPLNVSAIAKLLNVSDGTILRWIRKRQIPAIRIGDVIRIDGTMLADWIELEGRCDRPARAAGNPDDDRISWQDLGELVPKEPVIRQQKEPE